MAITAGAVLALCAPASASEAAPADSGASQVLVRFSSDADAADRLAARSQAGTDFEKALPLRGLQLVDPEPGVSVADAVARLDRSENVLYA